MTLLQSRLQYVAMGLLAGFLASPGSGSAQSDLMPPSEADSSAAESTLPEMPILPDASAIVASELGALSAPPAGTMLLWRLLGGGEVLGSLVKETPRSFYIDIGPTVIDVPRDSVVERTSLETRTAETVSPLGLGTATFDPETGAVVFSSGRGATGLLSQREILENVKRSVVLISNPGGLGTGWVVSNDGRVVTNSHVVGRELFQTVTFFVKVGEQWERRRLENNRVIAQSDLLDIAIVQLDMEQVRSSGIVLSPLMVAPSGALEAGDAVYAVGNPGMGAMVLSHTISEGIVSSLARNFNDVIYLQTTAAVNPGNSGGPLVNTRGEVVGLITLRATFQEGVAFALPVDYMHHFLRNSEAFSVSEFIRNQSFRYHSPE